MRVISLNANGIRAAARKGLFDWLAEQNAQFVCIQETKAQEHQLTDEAFWPQGYYCYYFDAIRPGYSGVAIYSAIEPSEVIAGFGIEEFDNEGRYLELQVGKLSVVSLYAPSGSSGPERQSSKDRFLVSFTEHLRALRRKRRQFVICGDWNIAHKQIDLKNWRSNQKNSGFLPHERAWMDQLFDGLGFVDAFRVVNQEAEQYTWWSNRGQAWAKNVGWRIDYQVISPRLRDTVRSVSIYKDERFSDHAPLTIDYDFEP